MPKPTKVSSLPLMTSQAKLGVSYIQLNNGLINCTHVGRFSHLPQSVNHYLILNYGRIEEGTLCCSEACA